MRTGRLCEAWHTCCCVPQVSVYTFGAPRAGNHSFVRVYERVVPDTWHVINDQVHRCYSYFYHSYCRCHSKQYCTSGVRQC